ncbi:hypothetical protein CR513_27303, partial [Mucuna pruriens]
MPSRHNKSRECHTRISRIDPATHEETIQQPNKEWPNCVIHVNDPAQRSSQLQLNSAAMSLLENLPCHSEESSQG